MSEASNGGALGFLDRIGGALVGLSTSAVTASVNLATARANLAAAKQYDTTKAAANSPVQTGPLGIPSAWLVGGVLVLGIGAAWYVLRRR